MLLEQLIKYGVIKDPKVLGNFLETGEIDSATEDAFSDSLLIRGENQSMLKGIQVPVVMTDDHPQHIIKHREIYSDPEVRNNPALMEVVLNHIQDHVQANKDLDPDLAAILQIPPLPSQQMQPPPPGGPEGDTPPGPGASPPMPDEGGPVTNLPQATPPEIARPTNDMLEGME